MRRALSAIVVITLLLWSSSATAQSGPSNCSVVSQNLYVRDVLSDLYYWNQFLPSVNAASYTSPEAYLEAVRYRPIDNHYSYITSAAANTAFYGESQFVGLGFTWTVTNDEMRVLRAYADSPAAEGGLARGSRIVEVNGQDVDPLIANGTIGNAFGASEIGVAVDLVFESLTGERQQAHMVKRVVTIPTVSLTRVFEVDGKRVGYIFFTNFVTPSYAALDEAFATLRDAGANELVLDLRYNGGGLVDVAVHLASLIGGSKTAGQVLATYAHNSRNTALNKTLRFESIERPLDLQQLTVITTRSSASASELVINALRPYMPVTIIGDTTYGKPVGQYGITFCDKVLAPVSFALKNVNGQGDYFDGLPATCGAADDSTHDLGDAGEAALAEALTYIRTGACSPGAERMSRALRAAPPAFRLDGFRALINAW
ncbi:MAG: S41 family peptidase [Vicinamibacterales bacterium]